MTQKVSQKSILLLLTFNEHLEDSRYQFWINAICTISQNLNCHAILDSQHLTSNYAQFDNYSITVWASESPSVVGDSKRGKIFEFYVGINNEYWAGSLINFTESIISLRIQEH